MSEDKKRAVREELVNIKQKFKKFKNISTTFPFKFSVDYIPDQDLNVDFDGLKVHFSVPEDYPDVAPSVDEIEEVANGRSVPSSVKNYIKDQLLQQIKKNHKEGNTTLLTLMNYLQKNANKLITHDPKCLQAYIVDNPDGSSKRRFSFINDTPEPESSSGEEDEESYEDESEEDDSALYSLRVKPPSLSTHAGPNDIGLLFEGVDLKGISVFECTELNLIVHCVRCQNSVDVKNLTPTSDFILDCSVCTKPLEVHFYPHAVMSVSIQPQNLFAQIECSGCSVFDTLPTCQFAVMCFDCSHVTNIGSVRVRALNDFECEKCHTGLSLVVTQIQKTHIKILAENLDSEGLTPHQRQQALAAKKNKAKKKTANSTISLGSTLPQHGTCKHYKHSQRWLRFPCCGKAYPCDICHEEACSEMTGEAWANRMICGHCSFEQPVSSSCKACNKSLTKRRAPGVDGNIKLGRSAIKKREAKTKASKKH
ncbi:hypothetical protein AKO1_013253 [Acrasis kona]|uniref:CHY-type domain-containing protein n=1 Tax=Acrasis kona TaxID=1008807 RepID=A0AAW2YZH5_9EUKA